WALWPLLGFAFVLLAAPNNAEEATERGTVPHFLSNRFFGWIGDHAYALYLWHWPLLIFYLAIRDREAVGIRGATVILAVTVVLSMLMYKFVEKPMDTLAKEKRGPRLNWTSLGAGVTAMAVGALVAFPQIPQTGDRLTSSLDFDTSTYPGALSLDDRFPVPDAEPIPDLGVLHLAHPNYTSRDCQQTVGEGPGTDEVTVCDDPNAPEEPTARVALAAGSHAGHWEAAVRSIGATYDWEVLVVTKSGCVLQDNDYSGKSMCQGWNDKFIDWVGEHDIDLVITPGTRVNGQERNQSITEGAPKRWAQIREQDIELLLLRGTARPGDGGGECQQAGTPPKDCGVVAGDVATANPLEPMELPEGTETVDMTPQACPTAGQGEDAWCPS